MSHRAFLCVDRNVFEVDYRESTTGCVQAVVTTKDCHSDFARALTQYLSATYGVPRYILNLRHSHVEMAIAVHSKGARMDSPGPIHLHSASGDRAADVDLPTPSPPLSYGGGIWGTQHGDHATKCLSRGWIGCHAVREIDLSHHTPLPPAKKKKKKKKVKTRLHLRCPNPR